MSRHRAHSPPFRTFPWEDPNFDPEKVVAELDGMPLGWGEDRGPRDSWGERRHSQERRSEEPYHKRRSSPFREPPHYSGAGEGPRHREAFRESFRHNEDRRREVPPELDRNYTQREPGWRQDHPERGSGERFRDRSPHRHDRNHRQRGRGRGQYRRPNRNHIDKWTPNQANQQHINRDRREMDGSPRSG